jgi:hypothetical protein
MFALQKGESSLLVSITQVLVNKNLQYHNSQPVKRILCILARKWMETPISPRHPPGSTFAFVILCEK